MDKRDWEKIAKESIKNTDDLLRTIRNILQHISASIHTGEMNLVQADDEIGDLIKRISNGINTNRGVREDG